MAASMILALMVTMIGFGGLLLAARFSRETMERWRESPARRRSDRKVVCGGRFGD